MRSYLCAASMVAVLLITSCGDSNCPGTPCDKPPQITSLPDTSVVVGDTLRLQVEAVDPEGQALVYRLVVPWMPGTELANAVLDSLSGAFTFVPADSDRPLRWFGFFVRDPAGNESSISIYVAVIARSLLDMRGPCGRLSIHCKGGSQ